MALVFSRFILIIVFIVKLTGCALFTPPKEGLGDYTYDNGWQYIGHFKNSKRHGQGTLTSPSGQKYAGEFKDDKKHGQGTLTYPDGGKYTGQFKNSSYNGQGILTWSNGSKYEGQFKGGNYNGHGTFTWRNGKKYIGQYKDDKKHGQGTLTLSNGYKYVGEFKEDKEDGQGTVIYSSGAKYVGEFKHGKQHGQGTLSYGFELMGQYVGQFKDGEKHGQGTWTMPSEKYVGQFKDGKKHGQGTITWHNGQKYVGQFDRGYFHGQGTWTWPNGQKYIGQYRRNSKHGQGIFTWPDGGKYVGQYRYGYKHGQGTFTWPGGRYLTGEIDEDRLKIFVPGLPSTKGNLPLVEAEPIYVESSNEIHVLKNQKGLKIDSDGNHWLGHFDNGKFEGRVTYTNGDIYIGRFEKGVKNSFGKTINTNGTIDFDFFVKGKASKREHFSYHSNQCNMSKISIENKDWIYVGVNCKNGLPNGKGAAISVDEAYIIVDAQFKQGNVVYGRLIEGSNDIEVTHGFKYFSGQYQKYQGRYFNNKRHGKSECDSSLYIEGRETEYFNDEPCEFDQGVRIDKTFIEREALRNKHLKLLAQKTRRDQQLELALAEKERIKEVKIQAELNKQERIQKKLRKLEREQKNAERERKNELRRLKVEAEQKEDEQRQNDKWYAAYYAIQSAGQAMITANQKRINQNKKLNSYIRQNKKDQILVQKRYEENQRRSNEERRTLKHALIEQVSRTMHVLVRPHQRLKPWTIYPWLMLEMPDSGKAHH